MPNRHFTVLALLVAVLLARLPAVAQETLSSVQRELDRVEKEIEREKELSKTERKRAADFEADKAAKLKAFQEQIGFSAGKIDSLKNQMAQAGRQKAGFKNQIALYQGKQKEFLKTLVRQIREHAKSLKNDFPYQREKRVSDLEELALALENGGVSPEEGLNRLFSLMQSSLDFAYGSEVYHGSYQARTGSNHEGNYVRLGSVLLAFASDDGSVAAFLARDDSGYAWRDTGLAPETRRDILTAVKVAQGKTAPQLVNLPFLAPKLSAGSK